MSDQGTGSASASGPPARGRAAVAASMLAVLLIGGYVAAAPDTASAMSAEFAVNAVILVLAFWFPATRVGSPADVLAAWKALVPWLLAWTLVWDLATSGIVGRRALLQDWWLVYPAGVATFFVLLLFHGLVVARVGAGEGDG
ncbi:MAG: hypothetical protein R6U63_15115 [Longimicrobiales bacterium]